jgi:hypothetical protein
MMEELATLVKNADGPAGEKVKHRGKPGLYLYILPVQYRSVVTTKLC